MSITAEFALERYGAIADRSQLISFKGDIRAEHIVFVPACAVIADSLEFIRRGDKGVDIPVGIVVIAEVILLDITDFLRFAYAFKAR